MIRDRSLFSGGGRATMFGGGSIFLKPHFGEGHFLKNAFEGRATIFLAHKYSVSIYLKSSNSQFTLFEPTVSALCNYMCKRGALFYKKSL